MSLADNIALQLVEAIAGCTPENLRNIAAAKAESLKLTGPEQKKREEYLSLMEKTEQSLEELKAAQAANAIAEKSLQQWAQNLGKQEEELSKSRDNHQNAEQELANKIKAHAQNEKSLADYSKHLDSIAEAQKKENERLVSWRESLSEEASNIERAQLLIMKKK